MPRCTAVRMLPLALLLAVLAAPLARAASSCGNSTNEIGAACGLDSDVNVVTDTCTNAVCDDAAVNATQPETGGACTSGCVNACWSSLGSDSAVLRVTGISSENCTALASQMVAANDGITVFSATAFSADTEATSPLPIAGACLETLAAAEWRLYGERCYLIASKAAREVQWPARVPYSLTCSATGSLCSADSFYSAMRACQGSLDDVSAAELALTGLLLSRNPPSVLTCLGASCPFQTTQRSQVEEAMGGATSDSKTCQWLRSYSADNATSYECSWSTTQHSNAQAQDGSAAASVAPQSSFVPLSLSGDRQGYWSLLGIDASATYGSTTGATCAEA